jgi:oxalate decarboxylase/phosphoglucose isomerase-like protein (cupin superfamily)
LTNRNMLTPETVGARHGRFGTALATPGTGSFWHTHPADVGEEDLFYTIRGTGTMVYLHGGKVHSFEFHAGDAIHSHHLTNFTTNHTDADLEMVYSGAPHPPGTIVDTLA